MKKWNHYRNDLVYLQWDICTLLTNWVLRVMFRLIVQFSSFFKQKKTNLMGKKSYGFIDIYKHPPFAFWTNETQSNKSNIGCGAINLSTIDFKKKNRNSVSGSVDLPLSLICGSHLVKGVVDPRVCGYQRVSKCGHCDVNEMTKI
jgi:hypothetical protein